MKTGERFGNACSILNFTSKKNLWEFEQFELDAKKKIITPLVFEKTGSLTQATDFFQLLTAITNK